MDIKWHRRLQKKLLSGLGFEVNKEEREKKIQTLLLNELDEEDHKLDDSLNSRLLLLHGNHL